MKTLNPQSQAIWWTPSIRNMKKYHTRYIIKAFLTMSEKFLEWRRILKASRVLGEMERNGIYKLKPFNYKNFRTNNLTNKFYQTFLKEEPIPILDNWVQNTEVKETLLYSLHMATINLRLKLEKDSERKENNIYLIIRCKILNKIINEIQKYLKV